MGIYIFKFFLHLSDKDLTLYQYFVSFSGFGNSESEKGFSLNSALKVIEDLAKFHATTLALKFKKSQVFNEKVRSLCAPFTFKCNKAIFETIKKFIQSFPELAHLADKASSFPEKNTSTTFREPFACVVHCDVSVYNVLNKTAEDGSIRNIFIDFQLYDYRSLASDIFFFLWTSVRKEVLEKHLDYLLEYYHNNLLNMLKEYKIDSAPFAYENFEKELQMESEFEFGHALLCIFYSRIVSIAEDDEEVKLEVDDIDPEMQEMIHFMVVECAKRGWL